MNDDLKTETKLSYNGYLRVPELIGLQQCHSTPEQHNELLFIIVHQTYELWFKQILHEIDAAIDWMINGRLHQATRALRRVVEIEHVLVSQIRILETMTPYGFLLFRTELEPASGFQSMQFREIEFSSGLKDAAMLAAFASDPLAYGRLKVRFETASLADAFQVALRAKGLDVPADEPSDTQDLKAEKQERRVKSIVRLLAEYETRPEEFELQESLIEHDEQISLWRLYHLKMVERMVGAKRGTGGSEGVGYLETTLGKKFFPDLWQARTLLDANGPAGLCPVAHT